MVNYKRIVIKIGTTSLTYPTGKLNLARIDELAFVISDICNRGLSVILVTSGAIGVGADHLGIERPRDIVGKQAASSVGQAILMQIYQQAFIKYNRRVAQILLTKDIIDMERRKTNAKNAIEYLLQQGVVPIVNTNDTVTTDELDEISDNDRLASYVAVLTNSDLLVLFSDIDGLYTENPKNNPSAKIINRVTEINQAIKEKAGGAGSNLGTGGMETKIEAAQLIMQNNIDMIIALGENPRLLYKILNGEEVGTLFTKRSDD